VIDLLRVGFDAATQCSTKLLQEVGEEFDGVQIVEDDDGLEDVELENCLASRRSDGRVICP